MGAVERFKEYLDFKGISNHKAEIDCGLSNGLIKNAIKAGSSFGSDKLENILNTYLDLSAEWLLRGVGSMTIGEEGAKIQELETRIAKMSGGRKNQEEAYDVILSMVDMVSKTYDFFERNKD